MTTPCYPIPGCAVALKVRRLAFWWPPTPRQAGAGGLQTSSPYAGAANNAWNVNFNNGNVNNNNRSNANHVRLVRASQWSERR